MPQMVGVIFNILILGFILKLLRQPHVVAYLIVGIIIIGPWGFSLINNTESIMRLGAAGVVFLLFFVGMETDITKLVENWKLAIFGTVIQVLLSVAFVWILGLYFHWAIERVVLIGFVISLSSTAIVIKLLQDNNSLNSKVGQGVLGILLAQDLAIIPMLIIIGLYNDSADDVHIGKQVIGSLIAASVLAYIIIKKSIHLPLSKWLKNDHELQLFAALGICFGLSLMTGWFELSTALGAFVGGMIVGAAKETQWVHHSLEPLKVIFVALFFISVGMMLDVNFLLNNWLQVVSLVIAALLTNTFINAALLRASKFSWKESLYAGALLSQIGEFSFVLTAVGHQASIINDYGYQLALCVISLSLLVSPAWIASSKKIIGYEH